MLASPMTLPAAQPKPIIHPRTPTSIAPRSRCETDSTYVAGCAGCRKANAAYKRWRRRQIAYGRMERLVDPGPACRYLAELVKVYDLSPQQLGPIAGLSATTIRRLLEGQRAKIKPQTEKAVLGLTPAKIRAELTGTVSALGASRRVQSLYAIGWGDASQASHLRVGAETVRMWRLGEVRRGRIGVANYRRVCALYRQLHSRPGPDIDAVQDARERGYPPPICWNDDGDIDSPLCKPKQYGAFVAANPDPRTLPSAL